MSLSVRSGSASIYIVAIESSCDDCCIAITKNRNEILSSKSFTDSHAAKQFNGVMPEYVARSHLRVIQELYRAALSESAIDPRCISCVAVTEKPGLFSSLSIGIAFAEGLSLALQVPLLKIDHLLAHLYAIQMVQSVAYPHIGVILSGGNTLFGIVHSYNDFTVLGKTVDDACGEAYDKIAKHLNLGYPGGPAIDRLSQSGDQQALSLPDPMKHQLNISFSGLKNAVINHLENYWNDGYDHTVENLCAGFQSTVNRIVSSRIEKMVDEHTIEQVVIGGGVACNQSLRNHLSSATHYSVHFPPKSLCVDNAVMIAGIAFEYYMEER